MISLEYRIIEITAAAEKHGNLNLRSCGPAFFPKDVHGGTNRKSTAARKLRIVLPDGRYIVETDIPTDKKSGKPRGFFLERKWVKDFVKAYNLKPGDQIRIERKTDYEYAINFPNAATPKNNAVFVRNENQSISKQKTKNLMRNKKLPTLFGDAVCKGIRFEKIFVGNTKPLLFYQHDNGQLWQGDSIQWLKSLPSDSVDMIFAAPPLQH